MRTSLTAIVSLAPLCTGATAALAQDETAGPAPVAAPTIFESGPGGFENTGLEFPEPVMDSDTGILEMRDGWLEFMVKSEDPRIAGPYRVEPLNMDIDPSTGIARMWGTGRMVRDEGTFEEPIMGFTRPVGEGVDAYTASGWLTGNGAYEGLVYYYRGTFDGVDAFLESILFEGEAPPHE